MRQSYLRRPLSVVLSLLMVIGLFTVCGFGAMAKQTAESAVIQSWDANALGEAASTEQNSHGKPIYEMTGDVIGRRVVDKGGDFLFHSAYFAMSKIKVGDKLTATIRIFFNSEAFGNDVPLEYQWVGDDANFQQTLFNKIQYTSAPLLTDATYGYQYKELTGEYTITAADMPAGKEQFQLRAFLNGDEDANAYGIKVTNTNTGEVLIDRQGADFHTLGGITNPDPNAAQMYPVIDENNPYLASYSGPEKHTARTTEPYASINTDGMDGNAVLLNTLGAKLEEGRYAFVFNMASQYSLGEKKVTYAAMDGEKELASQLITLADVNATVGADSRKFEDRVLPFTVDAESAGKDITFQVTLHNETDYYLRSVTLVKYFDPVTLSGKDLADAAKEKGVPYEGYYTTEGNTVIGMTASATPWEIFWNSATGIFSDTVSAGDKILVEVDMGTVHDQIPGGTNMGDLAVRTDSSNYTSDKTSYAAEAYNALELKTDDTYGYKYRTVFADITLPSDNAAAIEAIQNNGLVVEYNNATYTANTGMPRSVYRLEITNVTTGKTLYKLTLDNETAVNEAKAAYDALDDLVKATLVDDASKQKLNACVERIVALKADKAAADAVVALIDALPENVTPADAEQVNAANAAYEALTEDQKKLVGADKVEKLEKALEAIQEPDVIYGDVNNDKKVDATDALWVLQHSVELRTLTETELKAADVTDLGKVDTRDALQILQKTVELIDQFDVEKN